MVWLRVCLLGCWCRLGRLLVFWWWLGRLLVWWRVVAPLRGLCRCLVWLLGRLRWMGRWLLGLFGSGRLRRPRCGRDRLMQAIEVIAESVELIEMTVNHAGSPVSAFEACLRPIGERPAGWVAAEVIGGRRGFLTPGDLDRGAYFLWAR